MKLCVVTGTRAEYGLLKPLIDKIKVDQSYQLQLLITGAHLSPEFGMTVNQVLEDDYDVVEKVEMLLSSDTATGIVKSMGLGMIGYADAFERLKPDALIILGDRYEMLAVASAAVLFKIPVIHLHGGEITEGAYDDAIRHAITKLSSLHFTSTEEYKNRVIQMGEQPLNVFNVGAIGLDNVIDLPLHNRSKIESELGISFKKYNYQVTFHPETLGGTSAAEQFRILLNVMEKQSESFFVITKANADTGGRIINQMIDEFVVKNPEIAIAFSSLGNLRFLSLVKICDAMVGNSSSGIIEAPSLHTATINIGDRQKGRIQADSILSCETNEEAITNCFNKIKDTKFTEMIKLVSNPYGAGNTSKKILDVISKIDFSQLKPKTFYNIKH